MKKVIIIDSIGGNIGSVYRTLTRLKFNVVCSSEPNEIQNASRIIMPGVGHFGNAMERLKSNYLIDALNEAVLVRKIPVLGICLGMQLMAKSSEEGNVEGLGWFDGEVVRFNFENIKIFKAPHIGWNTIINKKQTSVLNEISDTDFFYFVHSYHFKCNNKEDILAESEYENIFTCAVQKENIIGVQFHPEKSYAAGDSLLNNFINN